MGLMMVYFTFSLILFKKADSETWKLSENIMNFLQTYNFEGTPYDNITVLSILRQDQKEALRIERMLEFQSMRKDSIFHIITNINAISILNSNSSKLRRKMMGDIEEVHYSMMKSWKKEIEILKEIHSKKNIDIEDLNRIKVGKLLKQEYQTFFVQLRKLEFEIFDYEDRNALNSVVIENLTEIIANISLNRNLPKVRLNETNVEPPPKFDDEMQLEELEKLQRLSLMIKDQLYEMEKPKDDAESEKTNSQNKFSEKTKPPRWLLTERDLEEIRIKYMSFKVMFEKYKHPSVVDLRETFEKYGYTVKTFSKIYAEFFNITSILLECESKDDHECVKMIQYHILREKRFEKIIEIFADLEARNIMPPD